MLPWQQGDRELSRFGKAAVFSSHREHPALVLFCATLVTLGWGTRLKTAFGLEELLHYSKGYKVQLSE